MNKESSKPNVPNDKTEATLRKLTTTVIYEHRKVVTYVKNHASLLVKDPEVWMAEAMGNIPYIYRAATDVRELLRPPFRASNDMAKYAHDVLGKDIGEASDGEVFKLLLAIVTQFESAKSRPTLSLG